MEEKIKTYPLVAQYAKGSIDERLELELKAAYLNAPENETIESQKFRRAAYHGFLHCLQTLRYLNENPEPMEHPFGKGQAKFSELSNGI